MPYIIERIMVKDRISLIAAAAGGFMLFMALSGILQGAPVTALQKHDNFASTKVADLQLEKRQAEQDFPAFGNSLTIPD